MKKSLFSFMFLILFSGISGLNAQVLESDSLALVDFYNAAGGNFDSTWLNGSVSTWTGIVTADVSGVTRVTEINTEGFTKISGTISPSIGDLSELTVLKLIGLEDGPVIQDFNGTIPSEIWNLTNLTKLQIKFTNLTGGIPNGISSMINLQEINFQQTYLGGEIPAELFELPALKKAYLHQSDFTGTVPASILNVDKDQITRIYLMENKLDSIPFVDNLTNCKFKITGNFFSFDNVKPYHDAANHYTSFADDYQYNKEDVDTTVALGSDLTLDATTTGAEGYAWFKDEATTPIGTSAELTLSDVSLADEGTYVCKAQSSDVSSFYIQTVYNVSFDLTNTERDSLILVEFYNTAGADFDNTWLNGSLDTWTGITTADVDGETRVTEINTEGFTNISGTISPLLGDLSELSVLKLIGLEDGPVVQDFNGTIPEEIWNLTNLTKLQIKFTNITGGIPDGIEKMTSLQEINFQQTYLGGEIPAELFELPALKKAYLHQSDFTGIVPSTILNLDKNQITRIYLMDNKLDSIPFVDSLTNCKFKITGNFFSFDNVKPYHNASDHYTSFADDYQYAKETEDKKVNIGDDLTLDGTVTDAESYAWFLDDATTPVGTSASLALSSIGLGDEGTYMCKAQSTAVSNFYIATTYNVSLDISALTKDSLALVDVYNAAGSDFDNTWISTPISNWTGVVIDSVDGEPRVTEINTEGLTNISGTISPSIGYLSALTSLKLIGLEDGPIIQDFNGTIPEEIWNLTNLTKLQIKYTNLTGGIPSGIETMTSLQEINFQQTYLGGEIPAELFELPALKKAYLHQSDFTGIVPASILNVDKDQITRVYLMDNKLDSIPFVDSLTNCKFKITGNFFSFANVKPYHDASEHYTSFADDYQYAQETETNSLNEGDNITFSLNVEDGETYAWFKDEETSPISTETAYSISGATTYDAGSYTCKVQNSNISNFYIQAIFEIDTVYANSAVSETSSIDLNVYPNPCTSTLTVESKSVINSISVIDLCGKTIKTTSAINAKSYKLNTSDFTKGIYLIKVNSEEANSICKIVKN